MICKPRLTTINSKKSKHTELKYWLFYKIKRKEHIVDYQSKKTMMLLYFQRNWEDERTISRVSKYLENKINLKTNLNQCITLVKIKFVKAN
jgi:ATP-dependent DNA helicase RecQ